MEIRHDGGRFYMATPGGDAELLYKVEDGVMSIHHTFVPDSERGKGIAEKLALAAFGFAKEGGLKVKPDCPYIVKFLEKHAELKEYSI
ncbi:MAG TPA: GNAT family N-acetyltransferase [Candidatus Saccharimonadales bacterium]|nr:GNAT family N-acetyltransferase [Candidatus Saccharimonadales bacterium]